MNQATANFIQENANADIRQLALRGAKDPEVDLPFALDQIAGRQTARQKLPSWAATDGIVYPPHLSMEQCSSELTARYKRQIAGQYASVVDLTGGFGVDFSFLARGVQKAVYVECQDHLCDIARRNFQLLGLDQAAVVCADSVDYLKQMPSADLIYLDPARRDNLGGRTYGIGDCTPDVLDLLPLLLEKSQRVLLKLSPMLDWRKAVNDLGTGCVSQVHIVSVGNECKELLVLLEANGEQDLTLSCVNILNDDTVQLFDVPRQSAVVALSPLPVHTSSFLYEPNASIMKAGCFAEVSQRFGVSPVAQNSHLFVSDVLVPDFPGRSFHIDAMTSLNKRELKEHLKGISQANITVRNFPLSVADIRRRLKLSEGGRIYIFATTLVTGDKVLLICTKVI